MHPKMNLLLTNSQNHQQFGHAVLSALGWLASSSLCDKVNTSEDAERLCSHRKDDEFESSHSTERI